MDPSQIVETMLAADFATINLAYLSLLVAAFLRSMDRIRLLLVVSSLLFVSYGLIRGNSSIVIWNTIIGSLNFYRLSVGYWSKTRVWLTTEQEALRRQRFATLSPGEFEQLWALGRDVFCADEVLVETGTPCDQLYLVLRGTVLIRREEQILSRLGPGAVVGQLESSPFLSPSADWLAAGAVWLRCWDTADLTHSPLRRRTLNLLAGDGRIVTGAAA